MRKKNNSIAKIVVMAGIVLLLAGGALMGACGNKTLIDTHYSFDTAIIDTGLEVITVEIKSWKDFEDGEYQIVAEDGNVYLVHISNCTIIKSKE